MFQKIIDFLSSVGMMILGVILLLICSVSIQKNIRLAYPHIRFPVLPVWFRLSHIPTSTPSETSLPPSKPLIPLKKDDVEFTGVLSADAVFVVDDKTNTVLWSRNSTEIRPLASITKLVSILVLNDLSLDFSTTTVIQAADSDGTGSQVRVGEKYRLDNLWDASLIGSSNIAIRSLVRASGLSSEEFVGLMNKKVRELDLPTMQFTEPTGLSAQNIGSAEDVARLLQVALEDKHIAETLLKVDYVLNPLDRPVRKVWSTNMLLTNWVSNNFGNTQAIGKTGHIEDSGYNFVVRLSQSDQRVIRVVILGADANELRFSEARDIGEWVFSHYVWPGEEEYQTIAAEHQN